MNDINTDDIRKEQSRLAIEHLKTMLSMCENNIASLKKEIESYREQIKFLEKYL